jgi:hypothetical protein
MTPWGLPAEVASSRLRRSGRCTSAIRSKHLRRACRGDRDRISGDAGISSRTQRGRGFHRVPPKPGAVKVAILDPRRCAPVAAARAAPGAAEAPSGLGSNRPPPTIANVARPRFGWESSLRDDLLPKVVSGSRSASHGKDGWSPLRSARCSSSAERGSLRSARRARTAAPNGVASSLKL